MPIDYYVRQGGLMRCCLMSLDEAMLKATEEPKQGDKISCQWCSGDGMIFQGDSWKWNQSNE